MRFLDEKRLERLRGQFNPRLSMRCDITRLTTGPEIAPGYPPAISMETRYTDLPCYVWNLLYLLQGEFVFPEREYASGQLRALLPYEYQGNPLGTTIREADEIRNVRQNGQILFEGPLNIFLVVPHSLQTLLVLRGAH